MSILTKEIFKSLVVFHDFENNSETPIYDYLREWLFNKRALLSETEGECDTDERIAYYMNVFPKTTDLVNEVKPKGISGSFIKDEFNAVVNNLDKLVSPFNELTTESLRDMLRALTRRFTPTHLQSLHDITIDVIAADRERYFIVNVSGIPPYTDLVANISEHSYIECLIKILTYIFDTNNMVLKCDADSKVGVSSTMPKAIFKW